MANPRPTLLGRRGITFVAMGPLLVALGCGAAPSSHPSPDAARSARGHIVVIVMENHSFRQIVGSSGAPYLTSLTRTYVSLTHAYATRHPSLPNYLALTSGSTHGITTDCTSCFVSGRNLVDQLEHHGVSWKAYMESMPSPCYKGTSSGRYYLRHDPFLYYDDVRNDSARCHRVVPYGTLSSDLGNGSLPQFAWITPNICHDMHDCSVANGDAWAKASIPPILRAVGPTGIVIVVFDESRELDGSGCCGGAAVGGNTPMIIAGPGARLATEIATPVDQYSLLRLIEDNWGMTHMGGAADAPRIAGWVR